MQLQFGVPGHLDLLFPHIQLVLGLDEEKKSARQHHSVLYDFIVVNKQE